MYLGCYSLGIHGEKCFFIIVLKSMRVTWSRNAQDAVVLQGFSPYYIPMQNTTKIPDDTCEVETARMVRPPAATAARAARLALIRQSHEHGNRVTVK